jgi:hypothetical protein
VESEHLLRLAVLMLKGLNPDVNECTSEVRAYAKSSGTNAIVLWAPSMTTIMPAQGVLAPNSAWSNVDQLAAQVVSDGHTLLMCCFCEYPAWACDGSVPKDLSPSGWWAQYVELVVRRYPHATVIVLNEPNYVTGLTGAVCAEMVKSAAIIAAQAGATRILAPAVAGAYSSNLVGYTKGVLEGLGAGWRPPGNLNVGFAIHPYCDVKAGNTAGYDGVRAALKEYGWHGGQHVWCTEGGGLYGTAPDPDPPYPGDPTAYHYTNLAADEQTQLRNVSLHYAHAKATGCQLWAQYEYQDSMWSGWASGLFANDGAAHPLAAAWAKL